jgi:hypothetical protein
MLFLQKKRRSYCYFASFILLICFLSGCEFFPNNSAITDDTIPQVSVPLFSIPSATYNTDQFVEITTTTSGATIFYTLDGTVPTIDSNEYTGAIEITDDGTTATVQAIAVREGMHNSTVVEAIYSIDYLAVSAPTFSLGSATYESDQAVEIMTTTPGATIFYTLDGSAPTFESSEYTGAIEVAGDGTTTLRAMAVKDGMRSSTIIEASYIIEYPEEITVEEVISGIIQEIPYLTKDFRELELEENMLPSVQSIKPRSIETGIVELSDYESYKLHPQESQSRYNKIFFDEFLYNLKKQATSGNPFLGVVKSMQLSEETAMSLGFTSSNDGSIKYIVETLDNTTIFFPSFIGKVKIRLLTGNETMLFKFEYDPTRETVVTTILVSGTTPWCFEIEKSGLARVGVQFFPGYTLGEFALFDGINEILGVVETSLVPGIISQLQIENADSFINLLSGPNSVEIFYGDTNGVVRSVENYEFTDRASSSYSIMQGPDIFERCFNPLLLTLKPEYESTNQYYYDLHFYDWDPEAVQDPSVARILTSESALIKDLEFCYEDGFSNTVPLLRADTLEYLELSDGHDLNTDKALLEKYLDPNLDSYFVNLIDFPRLEELISTITWNGTEPDWDILLD